MVSRRILFTGYAPVHFLCFLPVYQRLRSCPDVEVFLSGGFRHKQGEDGNFSYSIDGFYDCYPVDRERVIPAEQSISEEFDAVVCSHTSDLLLPRATKKSVQIFHGVSFKNLAVREKALRFGARESQTTTRRKIHRQRAQESPASQQNQSEETTMHLDGLSLPGSPPGPDFMRTA